MYLPELWKVTVKLDIALVGNLKLSINGNNFQLKIIKDKKRTTISIINAEANIEHLYGQKYANHRPSHPYMVLPLAVAKLKAHNCTQVFVCCRDFTGTNRFKRVVV